MSIYQLTKLIEGILESTKVAYVSVAILQDVFEQPERRTEIGQAIMDFLRLPNETEVMESWLRANNYVMSRDCTSHTENQVCIQRKRK